MKKLIPIFLVTACSFSGTMVTMEKFHEVDLSTPTAEVVELLGEPYSKKQKPDGSVEYEYIERVTIGARIAEVRSYFITMKDGVVISKRVEQRSPLPYGFDSYDMQTTQAE